MLKKENILLNTLFVKIIIIITIICGSTTVVISQKFFKNMIVEDYWPNDNFNGNKINALAKDSLGYVWLGTEKGLFRFDGINYLSVTTIFKQESQSISNVVISPSQDIIFSQEGTLNSFDISKTSVKKVNYLSSAYNQEEVIIKDLLLDDKLLWVLFTYKGKSLICNTNNGKTIILDDINAQQIKRLGDFILISGDYISLLNKTSLEVLEYRLIHPTKGRIASNEIDSYYYINPYGNLVYNSITKNQNLVLSNTFDEILDIEYRDNISIWVLNSLGRIGVYYFGPDRFEYLPFRKGKVTQYQKGKNVILNIEKCQDNSLWKIENSNLTSLTKRSNLFKRYNVDVNTRGDNAKLNGIYAPIDSKLLYALSIIKGVAIIDKHTNDIIRYVLPPNESEFYPFYWILVDNVLLISALDGIYEFDILKEVLIKRVDPKKINGIDFNLQRFNLAHVVGKNNWLWFGTKDNVVVGYNTLTHEQKIITIEKQISKLEDKNIVYDLLIDNDNRLIAITEYGLYYLNENTSQFSFCDELWPNLKIQGNVQISSINNLPNNRLFITTFGGGIYIYNITKDILKKIEGFGLESFDISDVFKDKNDNYWAVAKRGLFFYNVHTDYYNLYDKKDNLPKNSFRYMYMNQGNDGYMYLGIINGYFKFDPDEFLDQPTLPIYIQDVIVNGKSLSNGFQHLNGKVINLKYNQNNIEFVFGGPNYGVNYVQHVMSKLDGWDSDWILSTSNYGVKYNDLIPGGYNFQAKFIFNDDTDVNGLKIVIAVPFWKKIWFYFIFIFGLLAFVLSIYLYRVKLIKLNSERQNLLEKQISDLKMNALKAQMNPHFIFNSLNSIKSFMVMNEPKLAGKFLTKFSHLIRAILNNTKSDKISLYEELKVLRYYVDLEKLRFKNKFDWHVFIADEIDIYEIELPSMLIQPFIENAIWHGLLQNDKKGVLKLSFFKESTILKIVVEDNGIGRKAAEKLKSQSIRKHKSLGLSITRDRLEIINNIYNELSHIEIFDLVDEKGIPNGTKVIINISI